MPKTKLPEFLKHIFILCLLVVFTAAVPLPKDYTLLEDGVMLRLEKITEYGASRVKLEFVTDKIIHVIASPLDSFTLAPSLMAIDKKRPTVKWTMEETPEYLLLSTAFINAKVKRSTGEITFTDKDGKVLTREVKKTSKTFLSSTIDGQPSYQIKQQFESTPDEAFYGLGQHQNGVMNYKGQQVELLQNNSVVAVPFMVSNKNYGILWDNYSITYVGDSRPFESLSTLSLSDAKDNAGWMTVTYFNKNNPSEIVCERPESAIEYDYLPSLVKFPVGVKLSSAGVKWEGFIESGYTGIHQFMMRYAGYTKLWIDGKLLADRWRQPWNPGSVLLPVNMVKGKKLSLKIEWIPEGDESYISLKWMPPAMESNINDWTFQSESGSAINYYLVYGATMDEVISGYREITGKAPMIPKWALGLWQSRERYKTQDEVLSTVAEFRKRKIPLDNIVLDWSYWEEKKWGSQEFDSTRFPDASGMIKTLHEKFNARFMISVWPKFYEGIDNYNWFNKEGWLFKRNIVNRQRDWIGKGYMSTFYDVFNPKARDAFWGLLNKNLYSKGVDAWWMDATEPDIHSNVSIEQRKQLMSNSIPGSSTTYFNAFPLLNASAVYEGQLKANPEKRVFILTRSAYAGLQRYAAATWSGDIAARWHDMENQISAGVNLSMSGIPYWTMDIGGFAVEKKFENAKGKDLEEWREQMTRWYQFGAFCPIFRVHGQLPYREIFNVAPENHTAYKSMMYYDKLRYRLMPYIYSMAGKVWKEDYTIMRGLAMDFGSDSLVKNVADQYMFGDALLVNPVYSMGATSRQVYLPATSGWYDLYTATYHAGGQFLKAAAPMEKMPLFVKEGSIIPFGPEIQYTDEKKADTISLYVYTGKDAQFTLYEDESTNNNYEKGAYATIPFNYNEQNKELTIGNREGTFNGMLKKRVFLINWIDKNNGQVFNLNKINGKPTYYSGKKISIKMK